MTNTYCEKHEYSAGMPKPCPDCAEIAAATAQITELTKERDSLGAQVERLTREGRTFDKLKETVRRNIGNANLRTIATQSIEIEKLKDDLRETTRKLEEVTEEHTKVSAVPLDGSSRQEG